MGFKRCNDACRECLQRVPHTLVVGGDYRDQLKLRCHVDKLPADSESFEAMYALGGFYKLGVPEKEQKEKAMKWFQRAAENGNEAAMTILGSVYYVGEKMPRDCKRALPWLLKAAQSKNGAIS